MGPHPVSALRTVPRLNVQPYRIEPGVECVCPVAQAWFSCIFFDCRLFFDAGPTRGRVTESGRGHSSIRQQSTAHTTLQISCDGIWKVKLKFRISSLLSYILCESLKKSYKVGRKRISRSTVLLYQLSQPHCTTSATCHQTSDRGLGISTVCSHKNLILGYANA